MSHAAKSNIASLSARTPLRRYVKGMGTEPVAYSCLLATVEWREENDVDHVLTSAVPCYEPMKQLAPHSLLGPSDDGGPVILFSAGQAAVNFPEILRAGGGQAGVVHYLTWMLEYCIKLDPQPWPSGKVRC